MTPLQYNERSWGIDVISEINSIASSTNKPIKKAGGELTLTGARALFPDVLLFGNESMASYLQGWELKFPDTPITDQELISNAIKKAERLKLNSFLLWNVSTAVLYVSDQNNIFSVYKTWSDLSHVSKRNQVSSNTQEWKKLLKKIILDLNTFFENGILKEQSIIESFSENGITDFICSNADTLEASLISEAQKNTTFDAEVHLWWKNSNLEYPNEKNKWSVLARIILTSWLNKFIFAHVLRRYFSPAQKVISIITTTSPSQAVACFQSISTECDFYNIFKSQLGERYVPDLIWQYLIEFNAFLSNFSISSIGQDFLQMVLEKTVLINKRKSTGQFATPPKLAELLARITIQDKTRIAWDGCCGTGTIARAIYNLKREYNIPPVESVSSTWASDKYSFPIQLTSLSLASPENIGLITHVFQEDLFNIIPKKQILFHDPNTGHEINKEFPNIDYFVSNLPFVQQENLNDAIPCINKIEALIRSKTTQELDGRSDLYIYLILYISQLLQNNASVGVIISNSWLATKSGQAFKAILENFYKIKLIVTSGKGRWFQNADVVTNILILEKIDDPQTFSQQDQTSFITVEEKIDDINDIKDLSSKILTLTEDQLLSVQTYSKADIQKIESFGLEWSALFADVKWLNPIQSKLINAHDLFEINRGERRGWDPLFFPENTNSIETDYLKPVLKSPTSITLLITTSSDIAFCCSKSIPELQQLNHQGALAWINRFSQLKNEVGKPLPEALKRASMHWYELSPTTLADLVASINFDERIFIAKLSSRAFVNQRVTRFTSKIADLDVDLCHALFNSLLGIFFIEALGFGRGLGVLDLSATKLNEKLKVLNPSLLSSTQISQIKMAFEPIKNRNILPIIDELTQTDRANFDDIILTAYGLKHLKNNILKAFHKLYQIRRSVKT